MQINAGPKRRLDPSKTARSKAQGKSLLSHLSQNQLKYSRPLPQDFIIKKYYNPVIRQEERYLAFLLSRFLAGCKDKDDLGIIELLSFYCNGEFMLKFHLKSHNALRNIIVQNVQNAEQKNILTPFPHFFSQVHFIIAENRRRKKNLTNKLNSFKKDDLKSTEAISNKQIQKILEIDFSKEFQQEKLNDTQQLGKLSRCLKKILGKQESGKAYKMFIAKMQRKGEGQQKPEGMLKFILNLEQDFSSIQQQEALDFSKESNYGLSDVKKKSDRNNSKLELKLKEKDKRLSTNFPLGRFQFHKKPGKDSEKQSNCHSTSKNSRKSSSLRSRKQGLLATPDQHNVKSKSKSSAKKGNVKVIQEKKSKLTDTERLYFDQAPEKLEKVQSKLVIKESLRKIECQSAKSKKKLLRR